MKQIQDNPWRTLNERYQVGSRSGARAYLTDFGAFIEIEDGVDGLVHVSDIPGPGASSIRASFEKGTGD